MEEPKKENSLNLIDTSEKKEGEPEIDEEKKNNSNSKQNQLILEEKEDDDDDEEEKKKNNNIINDKDFEEDNEDEEKKEEEEDEEAEEDENENANLNYDRHFDRELIVGKEYEFKTIQSAINEAKPNNIIKISPGIYRENITIRGKKKNRYLFFR